MSTEKKQARPRQVTTAGVLGLVGSLLVLLSLFDALQRLRSVEMRQAVDEFLAEPPGNGLGVSTAWVLDALHVMVLVNGALAAVTAVLAVYVVQKHKAARVVFSIAAGLLLLTSPFSGGVMAMLVAFAATMLWSRPARDWFAGREPLPVVSPARAEELRQQRADVWAAPSPPPVRSEAGPPEPTGSSQPGSTQPGDDRPGPSSYPYGRPPEERWAPPAAGEQPASPPAYGAPVPPSDRRPGGVTTAAILTLFFSGFTALVYVVIVGMLMFARDALVDALQADPRFDDLGVSTTDLLAALWVMSAIAIFWCFAASTLAVLVLRRITWARTALVVSATFVVIFGVLTIPVGIVHATAAAITIWLLYARGAGAWFTSGRGVGTGPRKSAPRPPKDDTRPPVW